MINDKHCLIDFDDTKNGEVVPPKLLQKQRVQYSRDKRPNPRVASGHRVARTVVQVSRKGCPGMMTVYLAGDGDWVLG